jgi:hypothetical protein
MDLITIFTHFKLLFFQTLWLFLYIFTVINVFVLDCPYVIPQTETENDEKIPPFCKTSFSVQFSAGVLLILNVLVGIKEIFQFFRLKTMYLRFENLGQCLLLGFIFLSVPDIYLFGRIGWKITSFDYQLEAFGIFLAWTLLLCQISKLPQIRLSFHCFGKRGKIILPDHGIYVEILSRVMFFSLFFNIIS